MSDRMLEVCSTLILIAVAFAIVLVVTGWMQSFLNFTKGVWDVLRLSTGAGTSLMFIRLRYYLRSRDNPW